MMQEYKKILKEFSYKVNELNKNKISEDNVDKYLIVLLYIQNLFSKLTDSNIQFTSNTLNKFKETENKIKDILRYIEVGKYNPQDVKNMLNSIKYDFQILYCMIDTDLYIETKLNKIEQDQIKISFEPELKLKDSKNELRLQLPKIIIDSSKSKSSLITDYLIELFKYLRKIRDDFDNNNEINLLEWAITQNVIELSNKITQVIERQMNNIEFNRIEEVINGSAEVNLYENLRNYIYKIENYKRMDLENWFYLNSEKTPKPVLEIYKKYYSNGIGLETGEYVVTYDGIPDFDYITEEILREPNLIKTKIDGYGEVFWDFSTYETDFLNRRTSLEGILNQFTKHHYENLYKSRQNYEKDTIGVVESMTIFNALTKSQLTIEKDSIFFNKEYRIGDTDEYIVDSISWHFNMENKENVYDFEYFKRNTDLIRKIRNKTLKYTDTYGMNKSINYNINTTKKYKRDSNKCSCLTIMNSNLGFKVSILDAEYSPLLRIIPNISGFQGCIDILTNDRKEDIEYKINLLYLIMVFNKIANGFDDIQFLKRLYYKIIHENYTIDFRGFALNRLFIENTSRNLINILRYATPETELTTVKNLYTICHTMEVELSSTEDSVNKFKLFVKILLDNKEI